jgi:hypothetical protein
MQIYIRLIRPGPLLQPMNVIRSTKYMSLYVLNNLGLINIYIYICTYIYICIYIYIPHVEEDIKKYRTDLNYMFYKINFDNIYFLFSKKLLPLIIIRKNTNQNFELYPLIHIKILRK